MGKERVVVEDLYRRSVETLTKMVVVLKPPGQTSQEHPGIRFQADEKLCSRETFVRWNIAVRYARRTKILGKRTVEEHIVEFVPVDPVSKLTSNCGYPKLLVDPPSIAGCKIARLDTGV